MFLIGGPAFSGTTLLALLLNQNGLVCLDEPDFHDPSQSHRGLPALRELFPDREFPEAPTQALGYGEATQLIEECERAIRPSELGIKTCDWPFLGYADEYRRLGHPVICIVRDIRDALVRPLPDWVTEEGLNQRYRLIWEQAATFDLLIRYEELVSDPDAVTARLATTLRRPLGTLRTWPPERVHPLMLKLERHEALKTGSVTAARVGLWRGSGRAFTPETHETAGLMGY